MILTANPGPSVCSSNSVLGILGGPMPSPRELRYHLAGERRHTYLKRQVVLSMTLVSLSLDNGEVTVDRMVKEDHMATVALEPGVRAREECAVRGKKKSTAKNS